MRNHFAKLYSKQIKPPKFSDQEENQEERCRVLVEESDSVKRGAITRLLNDAGFEAIGCGGPKEHPGKRCPLDGGNGCDAAAGTDVIFFSFHMADPESRKILKDLKRLHPKTPIVVEIPKPQAMGHHGLLVGTHIAYAPVTRRSLTEAIMDALVAPDPIMATLRKKKELILEGKG